ncbi:hypothetical protein RCL1_008114 [Eukaryota sp. TZLM3-RCL]
MRTSFPKAKILKSGATKSVLSNRIVSFLKYPEKFLPLSISASLSQNRTNLVCFNCGTAMESGTIKFSFCHCCVPDSLFPKCTIPCIVNSDLASLLSFSLSSVFQDLDSKNLWSPSPFWGVFDEGLIEDDSILTDYSKVPS